MFFTVVGFLFMLAVTFGPAIFILYQGYWMSKLGTYPVGALIAAAIFVILGILVVYHSPFHIQVTP